MQWTGPKIGWYNNGTVSVIQWAFGVDDNGSAVGTFVVDVNSINILNMSENDILYDTLLLTEKSIISYIVRP